MATKIICDICGEDAVDTIGATSRTTTFTQKDVCQKHLAEFKKTMALFLGQELPKQEPPSNNNKDGK